KFLCFVVYCFHKNSITLFTVTEQVYYKRLIDKAETCVNDLMAEFNSIITTVTGIGNRLGAVILAEIRNIHAFDNPAQLQA
ncbi:transposase, partial [Streptococcus pneumoniae]|nr:transposase [Streptococcus pneumoniae]